MTTARATTTPEAGTDRRFDRRLIVPMVLATILNPINSSMIAVSLIPIGIALGAPPSQTAWLVSGLYLATAIGQPVVGRLVDLYGARRLYLVGTALTGVAGLLGMVAPSLWVLVISRVLLGFGTCSGYPASMRLIKQEGERTGQDSPNAVLTVLAISAQTISVVGPTLGGLLIALGGWRATFAVNLPLSIICLVLGVLVLPKERAAAGDRSLDLTGMGLFAATLTALLLFLMSPRVTHVWLLGIVVVAAAVFTLRELRVHAPFLDLRLFAGNVPLLVTYARTTLAYTVSYTFLYGFTQWLEDGRGLSPSQAGLLLLPMFLVGIGVASITGRHAAVRAKLIVGALAQVLACVLVLFTTAASPILLLVAVVVVLGVPQGLLSLANQNAMYRQAEPARIASSAGLQRTFMYLGAIGASAATGIAYGHGADTAGLHDLGVFLVVVAAVFVAVSVLDRSLSAIGREHSEPART